MKKFFSLLGIVVMFCLLMAGADFIPSNYSSESIPKKNCGYTIIEAGTAVDCYGDTIVVKRVHPGVESSVL